MVHFRKITKKEIKKCAYFMTECFFDYPIYDGFFKKDKKRFKRVFYFFWYRVYVRQNYTYVSNDESGYVSIKKPGDKDISPIGLLLNPFYLIPILFIMPRGILKSLSEYAKFEKGLHKKYYNPETDSYFQVACVKKEERNGRLILSYVKEFDTGNAIYLETHTERELKLYKYLGAELLETAKWRNITQYVLRIPAKEKA